MAVILMALSLFAFAAVPLTDATDFIVMRQVLIELQARAEGCRPSESP